MTKLQTIREFNKTPKISEINIFPRKDGVNKFTQGAQNGNEQISILPTNYSVQAAYGPEKVGADPKCVLWMQPFRNLMWEHAVSTKQNFTGRRDANIIRKMVLSTTRPKAVQKTARLFHAAVMKRLPYVGIHWRYDHADFGNHCKHAIGAGNAKPCQSLRNGFDVEKIGLKVSNQLKYWNKNKTTAANSIFIAAPPKSTGFVQHLSKVLATHNIQVFYHYHLHDFVKSQFTTCNDQRYFHQIHDFISQLEQEIMMTSDVFVESTGSSWSFAVFIERAARRRSGNDIVTSQFL